MLEELWYGNICPETDKRSNPEEMKQFSTGCMLLFNAND